jgi:hypothetical protein
LSVLALIAAPLLKRPDTPDVALTRALERIDGLEESLEMLQRRILSLEAQAQAPIQLSQQELIEHNERVRHDWACAQQAMQAQQQAAQTPYWQQGLAQQAAQNLVWYQNAQQLSLPEGLEEYIRNCTPGRAEVLRRQG